MNLGIESETLEFKKTTGEIDKAMNNIASMLNKHGHGTVYFGVSPNGDVTGQLISASSLDDVAKKIKTAIKPMIYPEIKMETLDGKSVIRIDFSGTEKPYSSFGRYYKRVFDRTEEMTPDELKRMMAETDRSSCWENNLTEFGLESVDTTALIEFYKRAVSCGRMEEMAEFDAAELLTGLSLYEKQHLTNAEDNVYNLIRKGFSYIKEHINWRVEPGSGTSRVEIPEIPIEAIREIIVNSFAHADYRGISENEIDITPTRLEIYNPGEFPTGLSPEMFARQKIRSMPRNKVILNTLYKSKDVEVFGSGFRKVYALCDKYSIRVASTSENGGFTFSFYRDIMPSDVTENVTENVLINVTGECTAISNPTEAKVYLLLKEDPTQTRESLAKKTGRTVRTIQRALGKLSESGKIKRIGSNKTGYWEVF